jgi:hypothetical protein
MFFEHLKLEKEDFKDFLLSKKLDVIELPIREDYFSFSNTKQNGHFIIANGPIDKLLGFIFSNFTKPQFREMMANIEQLLSLANNEVSFEELYKNTTLTFVFQGEKVSMMIDKFLYIIINNTETVNLSLSGIEFSFKRNSKFVEFLSLIQQKTKELFESTYHLDYTVENASKIKALINTQYNLNAPKYNSAIDHKYDQNKVAQYMNDNYVGVMLSSVMNLNEPLKSLVVTPTVDMSRKVNNNGKFSGTERITFPVSFINKTETLLDHILINEWSNKTVEIINAMIAYQTAINNLDICHVSFFMPKLLDEKKNVERFELFSIVSDSESYGNNQQSFKIIFGVSIHIQVKDGTAVIYDSKFKSLDEAYNDFIDFFRKRVTKKLPNNKINNEILKLLDL